jgi:hypothetical protein
MADFIQPVDPDIDDPTEAAWAIAVGAALLNLNARASSVESDVLINGSFELPALGSSVDPTNWTVVESAGGTASRVEGSLAREGIWGIKGACAASSDSVTWQSIAYTPTGDGQEFMLNFSAYASVANLNLKVEVLFFYWTGSVWSAASESFVTLYDSIANPTSWGDFEYAFTVPRFGTNKPRSFQVKLTADGDGVTAGDGYFDAVKIQRVGLFHSFIPVALSLSPQSSSDTNYTDEYIISPNATYGAGSRAYIKIINSTGSLTLTLREWDYSTKAWSVVDSNTNLAEGWCILDPSGQVQITVSTGSPGNVSWTLEGFRSA